MTYAVNKPTCAANPPAPATPTGTIDWVPMTVTACPPPTAGRYSSPLNIGGVPSVVVFGGDAMSSDGSRVAQRDNVWAWNGESWHEIPNSVSPQFASAGVAYDPVHNQVVMFGGDDGDVHLQASDVTWTFDGTSWTKHDAGAAGIPQPAGRTLPFMSSDPGHGVFMFGGINVFHTFNDAWEWDGSRWQQKQADDDQVSCSSTVRPCAEYVAARDSSVHGAAPNPGGGVVILPGTTQTLTIDARTWIWNGSSWAIAATSAPFADPAHPDLDASVVFSGGVDYVVDEGHEYSWNGSAWNVVTTAHRPASRRGAALANLPAAGGASDRLVLFGGLANPSGGGTFMDDTWEQSGAITTSTTNTIQLSATTYTAAASSSQVTGSITRTGNTSAAAQVDLVATDGTAHNPADYTFASPKQFQFTAGQTSVPFSIPVTHSSTAKQFTLSLQSPTGTGTALGVPSTATVTIDATAPSGPPGVGQYVLNQFGPGGTGNGTLVPVDLVSRTTGTPIPAGSSPWAVAVSPDHTKALVSDHNGGNVTPIDLSTSTALAPVTVGTHPEGIAAVPTSNGPFAYVANNGSATDTTGTVTPINLTTMTAAAPITFAAANPAAVVASHDGSTIWVSTQTGFVEKIATATNTVSASISVDPTAFGGDLIAIAISPDGSTVWVAANNGNLFSIDTTTDAVSAPTAVDSSPAALAVSPSFVYVVNGELGTVKAVSVTTRTIEAPITVSTFGEGADSITLTPDFAGAFVTVRNLNSVVPVILTSTGGGVAGTPITSPSFSSPQTLLWGGV